MSSAQLDSFVQKFHQLWRDGFTAHLDLDAHAGKAWVGIRLQLDDSCQAQQVEKACHNYPPYHRPSPRGPSYWRRQEKRRQAAQTAAAASAGTDSVTTEKCNDCDKDNEITTVEDSDENLSNTQADNKIATDKVSDKTEADTENTKAIIEDLAEKAEGCHSCDLCDFTSNWKNGLRVHMTRMHKNIEQLDGSQDLEEDDKYLSCNRYWKDGYLGTASQSYLDALDILETSDLTEDEKHIEKEKVMEARKEAFGPEFKYYPPWRTRI